MKKNILLLLLMLCLRLFAYTQTPMLNKDTNEFKANNEWMKEKIDSSTLIFEGQIKSWKYNLLDKKSNQGGDLYYIAVLKPLSTLKGNADTTKEYYVLVKKGKYNYVRNKSGQFDSTGYYFIPQGEENIEIPEKGIYFANEKKIKLPNFASLNTSSHDTSRSDVKSIYVNFNTSINLAYFSREKTLKFLLEKFNLIATPLK